MADEEKASETPKRKRRGKVKKPAARRRVTRPYPKFPLAKALEVAQKIKDLNGGNPWTPAQIAEAIGMGPRAPDFFYARPHPATLA